MGLIIPGFVPIPAWPNQVEYLPDGGMKPWSVFGIWAAWSFLMFYTAMIHVRDPHS